MCIFLDGKVKKKFQLSKKARIWCVVLLILLAAGVVLSFFKPSEAQLRGAISQQLITDAGSRYSETYYSYGFANVVIGKNVKESAEEVYVGFANRIWPVPKKGVFSFVANVMLWIPSLLSGAQVTILLTAIAVITGLFISLFLALGKICKIKLLNKICNAYIFFFRGTPLLMQLYFIYYGLPLINPDLAINNKMMAAYIAFSLNSGAYCAEFIRAAIQSIDKGQSEAAKALGMSYWQTMRLVIIPQSYRRMIPSVSNEFIMVLKDASLVSVIALSDLTHMTKIIATSNASPAVYIPAMILYLIMTAFFTFIFNKLEKKFSIYE